MNANMIAPHCLIGVMEAHLGLPWAPRRLQGAADKNSFEAPKSKGKNCTQT